MKTPKKIRDSTFFEDYIGCLKRISDLSKKSVIGD